MGWLRLYIQAEILPYSPCMAVGFSLTLCLSLRLKLLSLFLSIDSFSSPHIHISYISFKYAYF